MARARSLGAERQFPRAAALSRRRWPSWLSPSHRPPLPPRKRVYPSFPPLSVASEKLLFADPQRNDSECAKISTLLSLGATARPKGCARRRCACLAKTDPLRGDTEISCYRKGQSARSVGIHTPALSGGATQRCAGPRLSSAR